jgi:hypothetical protein
MIFYGTTVTATTIAEFSQDGVETKRHYSLLTGYESSENRGFLYPSLNYQDHALQYKNTYHQLSNDGNSISSDATGWTSVEMQFWRAWS